MSEKENVLAVDLPDTVAEDLGRAAKDKEVRLQRFAAEQALEFLELARKQLKPVKGFWAVTLLNHPGIASIASASDRDALTYINDIELIQDIKDPRAFELIFHFSENPYFTNTTLSKKYSLPEGVSAAPADGSITEEMRLFEPEDLVASATAIEWKEGKDLCAAQPRGTAEDAEDFDGDSGSFFHFWTLEGDSFNTGSFILDDILDDPLRWFEGAGDDDDEEFGLDFDELDDEDDDDEGSVDLEDDEDKPPKKKARSD
ncbi:uncharacterized protein EHS24_006167 [Apiotrichum porosum]|uniref:Uncharacterized protein n=1 Tax=Apiotrichum porosum TaxID=105984 RepID=A0A427Y0S9_9TREE|nr:uncharacterized protein EHS24_006167 [Apiotrichum porosum]RSH84643.1 hypothetical protein EHS24_006167 [Apiotrichum porosum]